MPSLDFELEKTAFRDFYSENQKALLDAEVLFRSLVASLLSGAATITPPTVTSRVKDREESIKKFSRKYQTFLEQAKLEYQIRDHITDLIGVRVVCLYEDEVDRIGELMKNNFDVLEVTDKIKELESTEDAFGYKGLHMDLKINDRRRSLPEYTPFASFRFELQIRTIVQDAWSVLDHKIKYKKAIPAKLKRRINALAAQFETVDHEFLAIRKESTELEQAVSTAPSVGGVQQAKPLDAFAFLALVRSEFPGYTFSPDFIDGFVQELIDISPTLTQDDVAQALSNLKQRVDRYRRQAPYPLNPYTVVRHVLFLSDKEKFGRLLFDKQRANFLAWLAQDSVPKQ